MSEHESTEDDANNVTMKIEMNDEDETESQRHHITKRKG